jgi:CHAD domain-containing protein
MLLSPLPTLMVTRQARSVAGELEHVRKTLRELGKSMKTLRSSAMPSEIHKLRTATRRTEAIAAALPPVHVKKSRRLVKLIEPVRKAAGDVRDMDVLTTHLRRLARGHAGNSLTRLMEHLQAARQQYKVDLQRALHRQSKTIRAELKDFSKHVRSALAPAKPGSKGAERNRLAFEAVQTVAMSTVRELQAWPALDQANVHEFRLRVKELRYLLQLYSEADPELVDKLAEVQRLVGDWHDWFQLDEIAREVLHRPQDAALRAHIAEKAKLKLRRALASANALRARHLAMPFLQGA